MTDAERWAHLVALDNELLKGGVILSEWCSLIVREADMAFAGGANLATILTAVSGIETYLRSEYADTGKERLVNLINRAQISDSLKNDLHALRRYRNRWVHVDSPWEDGELLEYPEIADGDLKEMAFFSVRILRKVIYENQWI